MSYPPDEHMLRALAAQTVRGDDGSCTVIAPINDYVCTDQGGMRVGVIATLVDIAGASIALTDVYPDRTATVSLSYQSRRAGREGPFLATSEVLRKGSKQVVVGVDVFDGCGSEEISGAAPIGSGLIGFTRLPYRSDHATLPDLEDRPRRSSMAHPASTLTQPYLDRAGVRILDAAAGVVEIDNHDYVRNSFGTLNGGMVASLIALAGEQTARAALGPELVATDLDVHYVGQGGTGPIRTSATRLRAVDGHCVSRVELRDTSADDKLMAIGTVHAAVLA